MYSVSYRMLTCMSMDMAMPMPTMFCAHLLPARYIQEGDCTL